MVAKSRKASSTARGLGRVHQLHVAALFRALVDGALCWWCGKGMYHDPEQNWDKRKLRGDHSIPRAMGGTRADRLLHATCNEQRQDGRRDHLRPALTGTALKAAATVASVGTRLMAWP